MRLSEATVRAALAANGWSITRTAAALGLSRSATRERIVRSVALRAAWQANARRTGQRGRPPGHVALTLDAVARALVDHGGVTAAARAIGVSARAVGMWRERHPELYALTGGVPRRTPAEAA